MAVCLQHEDAGCRWAVWQVDETLEELLALLPERLWFEQELANYSSASRKLERTAVRVLLHEMLSEDFVLAYCPDGKPTLASHPDMDISISHTGGYVAVSLGKKGMVVGIDIEQYHPRILRLQSRFMHPEQEKPEPYKGDIVWSLLLHWSAKETMFKCMRRSEVDFIRHLHIRLFHTQECGVMQAYESRTDLGRSFDIQYRIQEKYVLTFTSYQQNC